MKRKVITFFLNVRYAFNPSKPRLILRLVWTIIKTKLLKRPSLRYVDFSIDLACNLRCAHCFDTALLQPGGRKMSVGDYARVARECMTLGTVNFSFQGGEPLLFKELPEIISACRPDRNVISVTTNGGLLDEKRIDDLKRWGVDILTISLDSSIAEEHDRFRGVEGAFDKTMRGLRLALDKGMKVTLGAVVTHQTLRGEGINGLIKLAQELRVLLYLILPVPAGRWTNNREILLTQEDIAYIQKWTEQSPYIRTDFQANLGGYGCGAVKEILYLTPYGDVLACPFMHISLGNIFEESIKTIRDCALENPYFSTYQQKCLVSTDQEFIDKYLSKTFFEEQLPISWKKVFTKE